MFSNYLGNPGKFLNTFHSRLYAVRLFPPSSQPPHHLTLLLTPNTQPLLPSVIPPPHTHTPLTRLSFVPHPPTLPSPRPFQSVSWTVLIVSASDRRPPSKFFFKVSSCASILCFIRTVQGDLTVSFIASSRRDAAGLTSQVTECC